MTTPTRKVAIVHDWILHHRGGENCLEAIAELFPEADLFTLFYDKGAVPSLDQRKIVTSPLNSLPFRKKYYRYLLPLLPLTIEGFDLSGYDLVISSSHCVAKGIIPHPEATHICYCHTPMRYAWDKSKIYFGKKSTKWLIKPWLHYLRMWDVTASHRVDHFIANSAFVAKRIERFYSREAHVVHPFVDLERFKPSAGKEDFYLIVSALVPYKNVEIAISVCERLGRKLVIIGDGPEAKRLKSLSNPATTSFLGKVNSEDLGKYYSQARALLFPGEEDFGIVPLEAMACGTPVIALEAGGARETIIPGSTGLFFSTPEEAPLIATIKSFETMGSLPWGPLCVKRAKEFSREEFKRKIWLLANGKGTPDPLPKPDRSLTKSAELSLSN